MTIGNVNVEARQFKKKAKVVTFHKIFWHQCLISAHANL